MTDMDIAGEKLGELKRGLHEVAIGNSEIYAIEARALAASPNVFDTGSAENFEKFLSEGGVPSTYIEYDDSGNRVGYLALSALDDPGAMEVRSIAVEPEHQQRGFGKKMMSEAELIANQAGRKKLTLVTSPENIVAVNFYLGLGYTIIDKVENYYGDGTPRYVLEKQIK